MVVIDGPFLQYYQLAKMIVLASGSAYSETVTSNNASYRRALSEQFMLMSLLLLMGNLFSF
jgi:hypothetical protein